MTLDKEDDRYYFQTTSTKMVLEEVMKCKPNNYIKKQLIVKAYKSPHKFALQSKEGEVHGDEGDYIIIGFGDEVYMSKKEVFENTYMKVED